MFERLTLRNFKRFSGKHEVPLRGPEGQVTIIAAENGVGKTTLMEAIHISLYGEEGFQFLHPGKDFETWLEAAYSVDAGSDRTILLALEMQDHIMGKIRISRVYWLADQDGESIEEEVGITIDGKPLEREPGERREKMAERWIQDYLPPVSMRRFLVDGERLGDLDPNRIDEEIVGGIDDIVGIGLLTRLGKRLEWIRRSTLRSLAPDDQVDTLNDLLVILEDCQEERKRATEELESCERRLVTDGERVEELQHQIENLTMADGSESVQLRMDYAISQSELTSSRKEVQEHLMGALPFVVAGVPQDLSEWDIQNVLEGKKEEERRSDRDWYLEAVIQESKVDDEASALLREAARKLSSGEDAERSDPLHELSIEFVEGVISRHGALGIPDARPSIQEAMDEAMRKLDRFEAAEHDLKVATKGTGISEMASELKELATSMGSTQAEIARLRGEVKQSEESAEKVEGRIDQISQNADGDSRLNRRIKRIEHLQELVGMVAAGAREEFAQPLSESFAEGFELLSRKSGSVERVSIDTSDYSTYLSMKGFEGNWLDRDLSATEKQHVGLALVYALRRASTRWALPLPVVVDTPTSRMDRKHKGWSVTKFYPKLSNQVVVLATSDDLGDGLFEELMASGDLGNQMVIREVSENSVEVVSTDLSAFFTG